MAKKLKKMVVVGVLYMGQFTGSRSVAIRRDTHVVKKH